MQYDRLTAAERAEIDKRLKVAQSLSAKIQASWQAAGRLKAAREAMAEKLDAKHRD